MLVGDDKKLYRATFKNEAEIESVVHQYQKDLFGTNILFIERLAITTAGGKTTIPDGFVIDIEHDKWYLIEAELASHSTWNHIAPQVTKQLTAIQTPEARRTLLDHAMNLVQTDNGATKVFESLNIKPVNIHQRLGRILATEPIIAMPIDGKPTDLEDWIAILKHKIELWIIEKFQSLDQTMTIYSIPDNNQPTITTRVNPQGLGVEIIAHTSSPLQQLLQENLIREGDELHLAYRPRNNRVQTGNVQTHRFTAIVRSDGIEYDGRVMSLSAAAVESIRRAGGTTKNANGWRMWRNKDGITLMKLWEQIIGRNAV